ncbi:MAG: tRNA-dihydrouridine synthase [bacterium]
MPIPELIKSKKPIIALAPMADYTDNPFCEICRAVSGQNFIIFREMVSAQAIMRSNPKTLKMCEFANNQRPIIIQLFGSDPEVIASATRIISDKYKPDGIDINMGCPVPKIANKSGSGAGLMKNPDLASKIIKAVRKKNPNFFLSVKTRLGWSDKQEILKFALIIESAGADLLTIHARTKQQGYSGNADWNVILAVKKNLRIPILANGDINSPEKINQCLQQTNANGVMIGRGALGAPWLLAGKSHNDFSIEEKIGIIKKHAVLHVAHYGEKGIISFRKHLMWYLKSDRINCLTGLGQLRAKMSRIQSLSELEEALDLLTIVPSRCKFDG